MTNRFFRLALSTTATCGFVLFLWYCRGWMNSAPLWNVVTINFAVMGWAWFVFDVHKPSLTSGWFDAAPFEKGGRIYRAAGVTWFKALLQSTGWNRLLDLPEFKRDFESIQQREWGTRFGEATHWLCVAALLPIACWSTISPKGIGWVHWLVSAIFFHAYPIMLQRYHRPRFRQLLDRMK